jgi:predicted phage tail protein
VERSTDGASFSQIGTTAQNTTTFTSSGLTAGTKYYYRVRASNEIADSGYSNVAEATTLSPPTAPTGLMTSGVTSTTVSLSWTDASSNETGFKIERSTDGASFSQIGTTAQNATTFTNSGLTPGAKYYYRVRASNVAGDSSYSNVAEATTALTAVLPAPSSVTATPISSSRVDVRWVDNSTNEIGFKIERSLDGTTFTQIATVGANGKSYANLNLAADTQYYYRVRAYNTAEHSEYSPVAFATPPSRPLAPTNLIATVDSLRRVLLTWTDNAFNEAHCRVYRSTDGVTYTRIAAPTTGSYRDNTPVKGQTNYYRVAAYNVGGESANSNIVEVIP